MTTNTECPTTGIVVIGRNEGARLGLCLSSLQSAGVPVVYVDSGSTDDSLQIASQAGVLVHPLDPSRPFSAARARNEGFDLLRTRWPSIEQVQFLDGDCTLLPGWLDAARAALAQRPECAVVIGHLKERHTDRSIYNHLCDLEWRSPAGDLTNHGALGGIMLVRAASFARLNGFNAAVIAGEDSEFGVRVALAGQVVTKLDVPMATHDANILRFSQWWTRSVRAGHAIGQRSYLNGDSAAQDCARERKSTWAWGIALPALALLGGLVHGGILALGALAYVALFLKIVRFRRQAGDSWQEALIYARFTVLAKWANGWGMLKFLWRRRSGEFRIIEYK